MNRNSDDRSLLQLSSEQYESNFVLKKDCINHVKKRVSYHLKTLKNKHTGFEALHEHDSVKANDKKKQIRVTNENSYYSTEDSDDDNNESIDLLPSSLN